MTINSIWIRYRILLVVILAAFNIGSQSFAASATSYVRELAKNHPPVDIIVSGPGAADVGHSLQSAILQHPENKHKPADVRVMDIGDVEASGLRSSDFDKASNIFILQLQGTPIAIPAALAHAFPGMPDAIKPGVSVVKGAMVNGPDRGLTFSLVLAAPDGERLTRLFGALVRFSAASYRTLPFEQDYVSNKLALFSAPEDRAGVNHWGESSGPRVWNYIQWYPLSERDQLKPDQLAEASEIYFINRSRPVTTLPPAAATALAAVHPADAESVVVRRRTEDGRMAAVFSAPSAPILYSKADRYPALSEIPEEPAVDRAADLRWLTRATLVVRGVHLSPDEAEGLRFKLAERMRQRLGVVVEEPDPTRPYIRSTAAADSAPEPAAPGSPRYVWLVQFIKYGGSTTYTGSETRLTQDPGPFTEVEPGKPDRDRDEKDDDYHGRLSDWRLERERWERRRTHYEDDRRYHLPVQWDRTLDAHYRAAAEGELRLMDLEKPAQPVWAATFGLTADASKPYRTDTVTVNGMDGHPDSLDGPPNDDSCPPDLLQDTAFKAASDALDTLQEKAWLPEAGAPQRTASRP